ncbi:MAG: cadherin-like domain-containing protein [Nodosilinea sp.]
MATLDLSNLEVFTPTGRTNSASFDGDTLRLTSSTTPGDTAGSAFSEQIELKNDTSFTAKFKFQSSVAGEPEGWTFILQNDPAGRAALGDVAPGLGYRDFDFERGAAPDTAFKIANALVVEFDTFGNSEFGDTSFNAIEVALVDGSGNRILKDAAGVDQSVAFFQSDFGGFDFNDGGVHTAWVDYDGSSQTLSIFLATGTAPGKPASPAFAINLSGTGINDLETVLGGTSAYLGFTAATGGPVQFHDILSLDFQSTPATNVPPVLAGTPATVSYIEQGAAIVVGIADLAISDANGDAITGATVTTDNPQVGDVLTVGAALPVGFTSSFANGVLTIAGTATPATYATLLQSVTYQSSSDNPPATLNLAFAVSDGASTSNSLTQTLAITPINDVTTVTGGLSLTVQTGTARALVPSQITVTDPDTPTPDIGYTVIGGLASGQLELSTNPGVAITTFTQANLAAGIVRYAHNGSATTTDSVQLAVDDGPDQPNPATTVNLAITITPDPVVNQPPSTGVPASQSTLIDTPLILSVANGNAVTVSDPDDDLLTLVVEGPADSILSLAQTTDIDISADPDGDESFTAIGTAAALNAALNGLSFVPASGFTGPAQILFKLDDDPLDTIPAVATALTVNVGEGLPTEPGEPGGPGGPALVKTEQNLLRLVGASGAQGAKFSVISSGTPGPSEFGLFQVDDDQGTVDGLAPGEVGYDLAALKGAKTIFSTLGDGDVTNLDVSRLLSLSPDGLYSFYVIQNGTADSRLQGGAGTIRFGQLFGGNGTSPLALNFLEDEEAYTFNWNLDDDQAFDDFRIKVNLAGGETSSLGANLQGGPESEVLDLRSLAGEVQLQVKIYREANFNNVLGFYRIEDAQGTVLDSFGNALAPGEAGYIQAAVQQWAGQPSLTAENRSISFATTTVAGGQILAPFIVVNGTLDQLLDADPGNDPQIYVPFLGANSDGVDHVKLLGDNTFGFEDLVGGGDFDYDDLVVKVTVQPI